MYYVKQVIFSLLLGGGEVLLYHVSLYICNLYGLLCSVEKNIQYFFPGNVFASCLSSFNNVQY